MTYIITRLCKDCVDTSCVVVCPVDCIYRYNGPDTAAFPNRLYIHPDECIDCGACEPECPWGAIFEEAAVPNVFTDDAPLNYKIMETMSDFEVCKHEQKAKPTADEVEMNKKKWGWSAEMGAKRPEMG